MLDEELIEAREELMRVLMSLNRTTAAPSQWKEMLQRSQQNTVAMLDFGVIAAGDQRDQTAANYFKRVLKLDSKNVTAIYNAGARY